MESNAPTANQVAGIPESGPRRQLLKAAILSLSLLLCSVSVTMAVVSSLRMDYPNASTMELQGFVNIPVIGGIIATLAGGFLAAKVGKKNLCLVGTLLCFIGGFLPMFVPSLDLKTALRVLCGFGVGLIQPLSASLIVDCFKKGREADTLMGFQSAMVGLGATIFSSAIAGIMTFNWRYFYFVYFIALAVFIIVLIFVPDSVNEIGRVRKSDAGTGERRRMPLSAYFGMILQIVFATGYGFYTVNLSLAAEETGAITAVQAATVMTIVSVSSLVGGFLFGLAKRFLGMSIGIVAIAMEAIGLALWANTASLGAWYAAAVLFGVGFCWFMPYVNLFVNEHTDASLSAQATSYAFFGNSVGSFLPPYVFAALGAVTGVTSTWKSLNFAAALMVVCILMIAAFGAFSRRDAGRNA